VKGTLDVRLVTREHIGIDVCCEAFREGVWILRSFFADTTHLFYGAVYLKWGIKFGSHAVFIEVDTIALCSKRTLENRITFFSALPISVLSSVLFWESALIFITNAECPVLAITASHR